MPSVYLKFIPPANTHDLAKLHVWESNAPDGSFTKIQTFTSIGSYPNWIDWVEVTAAVSELDWFAIQWETNDGAKDDLSAPVQGKSETLVGEIVKRVMLRSPLLDEKIVQQEAESAIEDALPGTDPYTVDRSTISAKTKSGITFLTLARTMLTGILTSTNTQSYTAGLVAQSFGSASGQKQSIDTVKQLIEWANRDLGLSYSVVMLLKKVCVAGGNWLTLDEFTLEALGQ